MATYAPRPPWALRARALSRARTGLAAIALGLGALAALSLLLRTQNLGVGYWIDEGLSVGIADRPLESIPGVLRQDGSPPLYYMLLGIWMGVVGSTGESATHALSLLFSVLTIPTAFVVGRLCFGPRAGWTAAALAALNPFLTQYAQETRMYALVILLSTVVTGAFVLAFVHRRRAALPVFALSLAALLYAHNWGLFLAGATGVAYLWLVALEPRGARLRLSTEGGLAYAAVLALYAPWVPTLLFQAAHTGAPWSRRPGLEQLSLAPASLLGAVGQVALLLAAGAGIAALLGRRRTDPERRAAVALLTIAVLTVVLAWGASQISPAWAFRYLAVALPPFLLVCALGLARAGRLGLAGLAVVAVIWSGSTGRSEKSNVRAVSESLAPGLRAGDLVISTQPEQIPVLAHYLPDGLRWATVWGPVPDRGVTDWRDAVERLRTATPARDLRPLLDRLEPGRRLVLVQPTIYDLERWSAPWTSLVRVRSEEWSQLIAEDRRFRTSAIYPPSPFPEHPNPVRATVLIKQG